MGVSRHDVVAEVVSQQGASRFFWPEVVGLHFGLGTRDDDVEECDELAVDLADPIAQPHAHITDDLLVAAATRVQLARDVLADDLSQATLVCRMNLVPSCQPREVEHDRVASHIFVIRHDGESSLFPFFHHLEQTTLNRLKFVSADDASLCVGPGKSNRSKDIFFVKSLVVPDRDIVLMHERINRTCAPRGQPVCYTPSLFPKTFEPVNLPLQSTPAAGTLALFSAMSKHS